MRPRLAVLVSVAALAVIVAASAASGQPNQRVPGRAAGNARAARLDVRTLLAKVALPSGATVVSYDPAPDGRLALPGSEPGSAALVDVHEFLRVAGDPADAIAWFTSNAPPDSTADGSGAGGGPGYELDSVSYTFASVNNVLLSRGVVVEATEARGGGAAVRIDAQDVYFVPRPRWEQLPAGITSIDVTAERRNRYTGQPSTSRRTVTDATQITKIASMVDALSPAQPWDFHCPADFGANVTLVFLQGSKKVASVVADGSGCGDTGMTVHGKQGPGLSGGRTFVPKLEHLVGVGK